MEGKDCYVSLLPGACQAEVATLRIETLSLYEIGWLEVLPWTEVCHACGETPQKLSRRARTSVGYVFQSLADVFLCIGAGGDVKQALIGRMRRPCCFLYSQ